MKYQCTKNYYVRGRLAFTKGNEYESKPHSENAVIMRSDLWQPNIATPPLVLSTTILFEYFEEIKE